MIGVRTAPNPFPLITKLGGELYPLPEERIKTSLIFPSEIIGITEAPEPLIKVIEGCLS